MQIGMEPTKMVIKSVQSLFLPDYNEKINKTRKMLLIR